MPSTQSSLSQQLADILRTVFRKTEIHPDLAVRQNILDILESKDNTLRSVFSVIEDYCLSKGMMLEIRTQELQVYPNSLFAFLKAAKAAGYHELPISEQCSEFVDSDGMRVAIVIETNENCIVYCRNDLFDQFPENSIS